MSHYRLSFSFGHVRYARGDTWEDVKKDAINAAEGTGSEINVLDEKLHVVGIAYPYPNVHFVDKREGVL